MNNEKYNQIIDEAYKNYAWKTSMDVDGQFTKEEFINKCKTDTKFSERWGLKIEERKLSLEERYVMYFERLDSTMVPLEILPPSPNIHQYFTELNIPTKLLTVTYNNETIESYE